MTGLTHARLKEVLSYNQETGHFTWLVSPTNCVPAGSIAGHVITRGYRIIGICGKKFRAHRLAFFHMTGKWPTDQVDHINGCKSDNRWSNLRPATNSQNGLNKKPGGASRFKGVSWHRGAKKWQSQAKVDGKSFYLGLFKEEKSAADAYAAFATENFPEFMRTI